MAGGGIVLHSTAESTIYTRCLQADRRVDLRHSTPLEPKGAPCDLARLSVAILAQDLGSIHFAFGTVLHATMVSAVGSPLPRRTSFMSLRVAVPTVPDALDKLAHVEWRAG